MPKGSEAYDSLRGTRRQRGNGRVIFSICCFSTDWAETSLRTAIEKGVHQSFEKVEGDAKFSSESRQEIENHVVESLMERLMSYIGRIESIDDASYAITKEFVTESMALAEKM